MRRNIFLAYSWDILTREIYTKIAEDYSEKWNIRSGPKSFTEPSIIGEIEQFKNQNRQLFEVFVKNIASSDMVIADITDQNPNVMIELGIAINLGKKVLIVSGSNTIKTPFNVSGIDIKFYKSKRDLLDKIENFLDTYLQIKNAEFEDLIPGISFSASGGKIEADATEIIKGSIGAVVYRIVPLPFEIEKMRDTKIQVYYKITKYFDASDWFGFFIRANENTGGFEPVRLGGILVNARVNGITDITKYPGEVILKAGRTHTKHDGINTRLLEIIVENENLIIKGDFDSFEYKNLPILNYGYIYLTCYRCHVEYSKLKIINTDTVEEVI